MRGHYYSRYRFRPPIYFVILVVINIEAAATAAAAAAAAWLPGTHVLADIDYRYISTYSTCTYWSVERVRAYCGPISYLCAI